MDIPKTTAPDVARYRFQFFGNAREYFGIWLVNILLSIVTLGIYSAWAKVRRLKYFYGNTYLAEHSFDYHANPYQILKGRIIAVAALIVLNFTASFLPLVGLALIVVYLTVLPWLINIGLRFRMRMTSYRNVRFGFSGTYKQSLIVFVLLPLCVPFTLGLITPVVSRATTRYLAGNTTYGQATMRSDPPLRGLYGALMLIIAIFIVVGLLALGIFYLAATSGWLQKVVIGEDPVGMVMLQGVGVLIYGIIIACAVYYTAAVREASLNALVVDEKHQVVTVLSPIVYVWITLSNFVATIATIGLLRPWAAVRSYRYLVDVTAVDTQGPLDEFYDQHGDTDGVAAQEFLDLDGFDFGF